MIYLNNIIIYSNDIFTNSKYIKEVLKYLCKASFYVKAEKYKFYSELVEYLEYILFPFRLTLSDNKIRTIQNSSELKTVKPS